MGFFDTPHLERLGTQATADILIGDVTAFYKIDGTNASIWQDNNLVIRFGSRNRQLDLENDNAGFMHEMHRGDGPMYNKLAMLFQKYPYLRLYGEWLVPHSLKTYREDAWKRFYVFDVWDSQNERFLSYEAYKPILEAYGFDYVPALAHLRNPSHEQIIHLLDNTGQFLVKDGEGKGEGIVLKNYDWRNKYGNQTWAKLITNEFKEQHHKEMGAPIVHGEFLEDKIVEKYVTEHFVLKEKAKIENAHDGWWFRENIPELLGRCFYELINEEAYNFVKEFKNPKVDFNLLQKLTYMKVKKVIGL